MKLKAFSLLEMVIVLAILAILMGIGWTGLINFRSTAEMQNAYSELVSVIKSQQNKAKNSVSSTATGVTPDFYTLFFANNKYYAFNCSKNSSVNNTVRCIKDETVTFRILPADIKILPDTKCVGIGFSKLNGKFASFTLTAAGGLDSVNAIDSTFDQTGSCNLKITHDLISTEKTIKVNLDVSNIDAK